MSTVALTLLVLGVTGSPAQTGIVTGLERLPYLLLALIAGVFVDRWNRRRMMVICDAGRALALASVALALALHHASFVQLCLVALLEGSLFTVFSVAEAASLPAIVGTPRLAAAFAQREIAWGMSGIVGPTLGGLLYRAGSAIPFAADAASYAVSVLSLLLIKRPLQGERPPVRAHVRRELLEGIRWIFRRPPVLLLTLLSGGLDFVIGGTVLLLIVFARGRHASPEAIGLMLSIGSIGPVLGYVVAPIIQRRYPLALVLASALWLDAALWLLYPLAPTVLALGLLMAAAGGVASIYIVADAGYRMGSVPENYRGRVNGIFGLLPVGLQSISLALAGWLAEVWGAGTALQLFGVLLVSMALCATLSPVLRSAVPPEN